MNITDFLPLLHRIYALSNVGMWICFILGIISLIAGLISISDYTKEEASDVLGKGIGSILTAIFIMLVLNMFPPEIINYVI